MLSILVVEDHAIVREPLARLLRLEGYRTLCASNGNEAIDVLESGAIDLILLDLMMPRKDGVTLLEVIRLDPRWKNLPVIVLTGIVEGSQLDRARELSGDEILFKSRFTVEELFERIRHRLAHPGRAA
ncbi:MAG TPA: response regulator [Tepidisphaeraceae bacterium]|jgi:CheY-like chemotaxis protein|nr:response regulator [Tepidisphaeraceae bacterium]